MPLRAAAVSIEKFQMSASVGLWMSGITISRQFNRGVRSFAIIQVALIAHIASSRHSFIYIYFFEQCIVVFVRQRERGPCVT